MNSKYILTDDNSASSIEQTDEIKTTLSEIEKAISDLSKDASAHYSSCLTDSTFETSLKDIVYCGHSSLTGTWPITSIGGFPTTSGGMWQWQPMNLAEQVESCLAVTTDITFIKFKSDEKRSWFYRGMKIKFDILFDRSDENIKAKLAFYMDGKNE